MISPRRERKNAPAALIVCLMFCYDNSFLRFCDILPVPRRQRQSLSRSPCRESIRRLSASASWESHPRALARTLSCKYHHSSRLSSPPPGAVPDGRILILRLTDLSATEVLYRINWYEDGCHLICQRSVLRNQSHKSDCRARHSATLV